MRLQMRKNAEISPNNGIKTKRIKRISLIAGLILFALYCLLATKFLGSACPVYLIFGIPCPGCGMTRAWISLFSGDIAKAFYYHPAFFAAAIIAVCVILCVIKPKLKKSKAIAGIYIVLSVAFLIAYIYRMIVFFPNEEPINYNENSLLAWIIRAFSR